jgi:hypothetical protein
MAAHRNRLKDNVIENNGAKGTAAAIRIRGETNELVFEGNVVRDTRSRGQQTQTVGLLIEEKVGPIQLEGNAIEAENPIEDRRE